MTQTKPITGQVMTDNQDQIFDIFVIGGGINGCGIARDAAGRGYNVALAEMNDFASATSSSSTKLFHGGLRYLEYFEIRLVREALKEREVLLRAMPHISWPMRFVLPFHKDMRFEGDTPTSKLLSWVMPWLKGQRPSWLIRLGLFLYDHLGGSQILPGTKTLNLKKGIEGQPLDDKFEKAFEYSDCWVEDSRLVLLNAQDAEMRGATILARTKVQSAKKLGDYWEITTENQSGETKRYLARLIVNAAGPWVQETIHQSLKLKTNESIRLVRGSHIVVKKIYGHDKASFFQGTDGRIIFAIPYEEDFTLIGTTDAAHHDVHEKPECSEEEKDYLLNFANDYFKSDITSDDIVWTYSGVRPLYDDGAKSATAATREYVLRVNESVGPPVLNIFGGKITTYRKLAEAALEQIDQTLDKKTEPWTKAAPLPGGDFSVSATDELQQQLAEQLPFFDGFTIRRLIRQFGTRAGEIFVNAEDRGAVGKEFAKGVTERELDWCIQNEWVHTTEDFLWRRTKLGLRVSPAEAQAIGRHIERRISGRESGTK